MAKNKKISQKQARVYKKQAEAWRKVVRVTLTLWPDSFLFRNMSFGETVQFVCGKLMKQEASERQAFLDKVAYNGVTTKTLLENIDDNIKPTSTSEDVDADVAWFIGLKLDPTTKTATCDCGAVYNPSVARVEWVKQHFDHRLRANGHQTEGVRVALTDIPYMHVDPRVEDDVVYLHIPDTMRLEETDKGGEIQRIADPIRDPSLDWMRSKP